MSSPVAWFEITGSDGARLREHDGSLLGWSDEVPDPDGHLVDPSRGAVRGG